MRFDKRSRKVRFKKKTKRASRSTASFWGYMGFALILLVGFYFMLYSAHKKGLHTMRQEKIQEDFDRICAAAILYAQDYGAFPTTEQGIAALVAPTGSGAASASGGSLDRLPLDPWQDPYEYRGAASADDVTLISWGADGRQGGTGEAADVIRKGCRSTVLPVH